MDLYKIAGQKLQSLERTACKPERDVQRLLEANLREVLGIRFLGDPAASDRRIVHLRFLAVTKPYT